jgi:hypothetical protein
MKLLVLIVALVMTVSAFALERGIVSNQRGMKMLSLIVDGTGTPTLNGPDSYQVELSRLATGTYTITAHEAFGQLPVAIAQPVAAACKVKTVTPAVGSVAIVTADLSDTNKDCDFNLVIIGSKVAEKF